jgi:hypothetical protein
VQFSPFTPAVSHMYMYNLRRHGMIKSEEGSIITQNIRHLGEVFKKPAAPQSNDQSQSKYEVQEKYLVQQQSN